MRLHLPFQSTELRLDGLKFSFSSCQGFRLRPPQIESEMHRGDDHCIAHELPMNLSNQDPHCAGEKALFRWGKHGRGKDGDSQRLKHGVRNAERQRENDVQAGMSDGGDRAIEAIALGEYRHNRHQRSPRVPLDRRPNETIGPGYFLESEHRILRMNLRSP